MTNPLLTEAQLPPFDQIKTQHMLPAIKQMIEENRRDIHRIVEASKPTWDSLVQPLEDMANKLENAWTSINHLSSVCNTPEIREVDEQCIALLSDYHTEMGQNQKLYELFLALHESAEFHTLTQAQKKIITDSIQDFTLSGIALNGEDQKRYKAIQKQLAALSTQFENNSLDATDGWFYHVEDKTTLAGIPEHAIYAAAEAAKSKGLTGWVFTLKFPSYYPVMAYADDRHLRQTLYEAYATRASETGPCAKKWDNSQIIEDILKLRHELANLLGYKSYAHYSLVTKMIKDPGKVMNFLHDLAERAYKRAQTEMQELRDFAKDTYKLDQLEAWDVAYFSEKLKQKEYAIDDEALRPYFPEDKVIEGLFAITQKLYGIQIRPIETPTWHEDVKSFAVFSADNQIIAYFYFDLYARANKRGGAWMADCRSRHRNEAGYLQLPVAYLTCNFTKPERSKPSLFTHDEVNTLFHEFGHGLHHMLTEVDFISVSGTKGVEWDAVELPSQFMENFCWEREALDLISAHYQTGEKMPDELFEKMIKAKNYHSAMQTMRQLEFALFDFRLHLEYNPEQGGRVQEILDETRQAVSVVPVPTFNRFQNTFTHIFAGGYAAGYYSYKWAEILSSDAYSFFEETGIFNAKTGHAFLENILSKGGSEEAEKLFINFRGRAPTIDAYLRHNGL